MWLSKARSFWRLRDWLSLDGSSSFTGRRPKYRQQTKGADPRTRTRKGETCSSLVSWPLSVLPCLAFCLCRGLFLVSGCLVSCSVPVFFRLFWSWASRSCSLDGRDVGSVFFPFLLMGTDPSTSFSRYPFMYVLLEFHFVLELVFLVSSSGFFYFITAVTGHFVNKLYLASTKGSEVSISRSLSQVVSHSTFYVTTAILTMINETWVANLAIFQRRWRSDNEDEPLSRDTLRTSALVFAAEADLFCAMQARFEFDLAGQMVVNTKPQMAPSVCPRVEYMICSR